MRIIIKNQFRISKFIDEIMKANEVHSISQVNNDDDPEFSSCDICGEKSNVYAINGFDPKRHEVVDLGEGCHECLCVYSNGPEET